MVFSVINADILQMDVDVLVIPANSHARIGTGLDKKMYNEAGVEEMLSARKQIGYIKVGNVAITNGYNLKAKYVIHAVTPSWNGGFSDEAKYLTKCYCNALRIASKNQVQSVAFALLGAGANRTPFEVAKKIAIDTIRGWLKKHHSLIQVYLVMDERHKGLVIDMDSENQSGLQQEREIQLQQYLKENPKHTREEFYANIFRQYLHERILNNAQFAEQILYNPGGISRLKSGKIKNPRKETLISLAIGMELTKEERYDFMRSANCLYPIDERDEMVEHLLDCGYIDFITINNALYEIDPQWMLSKSEKINRKKVLSKSKNNREK